jgi:hypothetical protein
MIDCHRCLPSGALEGLRVCVVCGAQLGLPSAAQAQIYELRSDSGAAPVRLRHHQMTPELTDAFRLAGSMRRLLLWRRVLLVMPLVLLPFLAWALLSQTLLLALAIELPGLLSLVAGQRVEGSYRRTRRAFKGAWDKVESHVDSPIAP